MAHQSGQELSDDDDDDEEEDEDERWETAAM